MKGFSTPNISIPNISVPNISFNKGNISKEAIKSSIMSQIPNMSGVTDGLNLEQTASDLLSEKLSEGIELPAELGNIISK